MSVGSHALRELAQVAALRLQAAEREVAHAKDACDQADSQVRAARAAIEAYDASYPERRANIWIIHGPKVQQATDINHLHGAVAALKDEREPLDQACRQAEEARDAASLYLSESLTRQAQLTALKYKRDELADTLARKEAKAAELLAEQDL